MVVSVASALRLMECTQPYSQAAHQERICQVIFFPCPLFPAPIWYWFWKPLFACSNYAAGVVAAVQRKGSVAFVKEVSQKVSSRRWGPLGESRQWDLWDVSRVGILTDPVGGCVCVYCSSNFRFMQNLSRKYRSFWILCFHPCCLLLISEVLIVPLLQWLGQVLIYYC